MAPLVRTEAGPDPIKSPVGHYYRKRLAARSSRRPEAIRTPFRVGVAQSPSKEDKFSTRLDVLGPLLVDHYPVVPDSSRRNLLAAFDKRCNFYTDKRADRSIVKASLSLLDRIAPHPWDPLEWTPELFAQWNAQFDTAKQAKHVKCLPTLSEITSKQFSNKQIFVKVEALLKRHDPQWAPRVINQSSDMHNALLGPVMWQCSKRMFAAFKLEPEDPDVAYMGAYREQTPALCERINRCGGSSSLFIESDFSSNDMTQVRDVHLLEVQWLRRFGAPMWLTGLMLTANSYLVSSRKHAVMGRVQNQLPTGAQSTTFRNTMWNASINHAFCLRTSAKGDCLILGDDMLMRYDNPISTRVKNIRREYEHVIRLACMEGEVKVRKFLSECHFLSKQFIPTARGHVLAPKLGKAIARFNARATSNQAVSDRSYLAGKALSYAFEFRFVPPLSRAFFLRYEQLVGDTEPSLDGLGWNAKGAFLDAGVAGIIAQLRNVQHPATRDECTLFYHSNYGLTFTDVLELCVAMLFGEDDLDEVGCQRILEDFV